MRRSCRPAAILVGLILLAGAPLAMVAMTSLPAGALTTITVATDADAGAGSLRQAFIDASSGGVAAGDDVEIVVPAAVGNITLTTGELLYDGGTGGAHSLTLTGNGQTISQTMALTRVIHGTTTGLLTITGLTITGGQTPAASDGGGINSAADTALDHVTLLGNNATRAGGGLYNGSGTATITIANSTIVDNGSGTQGGGGVNVGGTLTITNSTISGNHSGSEGGGGVNNGGGGAVVTIMNSTIFGNTAGAETGGGVNVGGGGSTLTITNSTISGNTAPEGGGIFGGGGDGTLSLVYATVVENTAATGANVLIGGPGTHTSFGTVIGLPEGGGGNCEAGAFPFASAGYSFEHGADTCGFGAGPGDVVNGGDPLLAALAANGGPTQTRLPQSGSPLLDAIALAACQADGASGVATDQRGVTRPQGTGCDIGAVEVAVLTVRFTG